jgi:hypothetical protein
METTHWKKDVFAYAAAVFGVLTVIDFLQASPMMFSEAYIDISR